MPKEERQRRLGRRVLDLEMDYPVYSSRMHLHPSYRLDSMPKFPFRTSPSIRSALG